MAMIHISELFVEARVPAYKSAKDPVDKVGATLAHCMRAVHEKGHKPRAAWNICRAHLMRHGYLKGPYRLGAKLHQSVRTTQKGSRRDMKHAMEKDGPKKRAEFIRIFRKIQKQVT